MWFTRPDHFRGGGIRGERLNASIALCISLNLQEGEGTLCLALALALREALDLLTR